MTRGSVVHNPTWFWDLSFLFPQFWVLTRCGREWTYLPEIRCGVYLEQMKDRNVLGDTGIKPVVLLTVHFRRTWPESVGR